MFLEFIKIIDSKPTDNSIGDWVFTFVFIGLIVVLQFLKPELQRLKIGTWCGNWILIYGIVSNINL